MNVADEEDLRLVVTTSDWPNCFHLALCILGKILLLQIDKNGIYRKDSKFSDRQVWAKNVDSDQSLLRFPQHLLETILYHGKTTLPNSLNPDQLK